MNTKHMSWVGWLIGAGLAFAGTPDTAHALYPDCRELGSALIDHACFHATMGPFVDVAASTERDFTAASPNINPVHTQYNITLPAGAQGTVKYRPQRSGDWTIMTNPNVSLTVLDAAGASVPTVLEGAVDGCAQLPYQRVYELQANATYRFVLGPVGGDKVAIVIEKLADFEAAYFADTDGDGFGDTNTILATGCKPPTGYVTNESDCNDGDASANPNAQEVCGNGADNDCDGQVDEDCGPVCVPTAEVCDSTDNDCDGDTDEGVENACGQCGAVPAEVCDDGLDNNCDGQVDEGCDAQCVPSAEVCDGADNDCDDQVDEGVLNACGQCGVVPAEVCGDGQDNNCDGTADEGCGTQCVPSTEICDGMDNDCDGLADEDVKNACGECGGVPVEVCGDQLDNNCDGFVDENCSGGCTPSEDVCDAVDNDCDGEIDSSGGQSTCGCGTVELEARSKRRRGPDGMREFEHSITVAIPADVQVESAKGRGGKVSLTFGASHPEQCGGGAVRKTFTCTYRPSQGDGEQTEWRLQSCEGSRSAGDAVEVDFLRLRVAAGRADSSLRARAVIEDLSCK